MAVEPKQYMLVVEDQDDERWLLGDLLRQTGLQVITASNGSDALSALQNAGGAPVVVFTDLVMPKMDGKTLVGALAADPRFKKVPVVVMTGDPSAELPGETWFLLQKPIEADRIKRLAQAAIRAAVTVGATG